MEEKGEGEVLLIETARKNIKTWTAEKERRVNNATRQ